MEYKNPKGTVALIAFYNIKSLGIRYLQSALETQGYQVQAIFYKGYNSLRPKHTTDAELGLLCAQIMKLKPVMICLSIMSSMYLDTVYKVMETMKREFTITPLVCGGAFATMFPERVMEKGADFVLRSDGETSICRLADALSEGNNYREIPCLCYKQDDKVIRNDIGDIESDINKYGLPVINSINAVYIENDKTEYGDPQLTTRSYEVIASRGCPFTCSYCCCNNLHRMNPKGTPIVRTRSVKNVIDELIVAKKELKKLVFVHFYDEIFPNLPGWVDEFIVEYKRHINLPFAMWGHPKMIDPVILQKLVSVGLSEVTMGIQSGSERVRKDIFHRYETQQDIIEAVEKIRASKIMWSSYDFMLQHPFETIEDLKETYFLVKKLKKPYELQLHGLNFLPGTDIVKMAINQGIYTEQELDDIMFAPMDEQFEAYWKYEQEKESQAWYRMTYCLQFDSLCDKVALFESDPLQHIDEINVLYEKAQKKYKLRYLYRKGRLFLKGKQMSFFPKHKRDRSVNSHK